MEIYGPSNVHGSQSIQGPSRLKAAERTESVSDNTPIDQVDISAEADFVSQVHDIPDVRADRVADIRAQIEAGVYETEEKLDIAVGRLLDEIG